MSTGDNFQIGDSIVVVGTVRDGELGTVISYSSDGDVLQYRVVLENGVEVVLNPANLSHRY